MKSKFQRVPAEVPVSSLTPLNIKCTSTKCKDGFHCFKTTKRTLEKLGKRGVCKECGVDIINWKRLYKNDISDASFIFQSMKKELVRHVYWHTPIEKEAIEKALKNGKLKQKERTKKLVNQRIGKARNYRDGYQTPRMGNEITNYAQHGTATCCRPCLEYWHNIEMGRDLTENELEFCANLIMSYIEKRIPELTEEGEET